MDDAPPIQTRLILCTL